MDISLLSKGSWLVLETSLKNISDPKLKGDLFEYFSYYYLRYYSHLYDISEIYCPIVDGKRFPIKVQKKLKLAPNDQGVDGVYITNKGEYVAWQSKFRSNRESLTARELSTFWAEAEYADYRLIISNTNKLPFVAGKKSGHLTILVDRFEHLESHFFEKLTSFFTSQTKKIVVKKKSPRAYQVRIIKDIINGFSSYKKGKVIAACGIGKTLISLWATERLDSKRVIFFAPSLQLINSSCYL